MKILFMGTPDFAVPTLMALFGQGHQIKGVLTRAPQPSGRGMQMRLSPVHQCAQQLAIPVFTPSTLKDHDVHQQMRDMECDVCVVVAYGMLLPQKVLDIPKHGCLNLHGSLLPRWRGAAPLQRAVMAGDSQTGIMVMAMEKGLDTGPVAMAETMKLTPLTTAQEVHDHLARLGADLMVRAIAALERGALTFTPQSEEGVTYAKKITKQEARINWDQAALDLCYHIHGLSPFPGAWCERECEKGKKERLKILRCKPHSLEHHEAPGTLLNDDLWVACQNGAIELLEVQRSGKKGQDKASFLRGTRLQKSMILT